MKYWSSWKVYDLLCEIDKGYRPTEEEREMLSNRRYLYLFDTPITALPDSLVYLSCLQTLDLHSTKITALPESFGHFRDLQYLNLSTTEITSLPKSFGQLLNLKELYLHGTSITVLPESFGQLSSLQSLDLRDRPITALPESFGQLTSLQSLILSGTQITALPVSVGQLTNLQSLWLDHTRISELPEWIGELPNLNWLNLSGLTLDGIPKSLALRGLPFVDTDDFHMVDEGINLHNTTLTEQDISIFLETPDLIPDLYKEQIASNECRVIFLGDGGVGKSYTIRRLQNGCKKETEADPYITKQTPGIEILDYRAKRGRQRYDLHLWDFGGQEILHSMHRCFLTDQTCYVVTVRTREDANQKARYWLRNVQAFAPNSPVLLFVNCWENTDGRIVDESSLRNEFPKIADVVYCSAKEAEDGDFRAKILDKLIDMVAASESTKRTVNRRWNAVRTAIVAESKKAHYLTKDTYRAFCRDNKIKGNSVPNLLSYFNSLGVCFSYHLDDDKNELDDYMLLNPVWLTNAIYAIIEEGWAPAMEGQITIKAIEQMLGNKAPDTVRGKEYRRTMPDTTYKDYECRYVLDVAAAHNLCYRVDSDTVFFPALCDNNTPKEALTAPADYPQHVEYLFRYDYLPDSVIHQLMVRCKKADLAVNRCWLQGMTLGSMDAHKVKVRMDGDKDLRIDIWSKPNHPAYEMFELLRREIMAVNKRLNLKAKDYIVDGDDRYTVIQLLNAAKDKAPVYGSNTGKKRSAEELLRNVYDRWIIPWIQVDEATQSIVVPDVPRVVVPVVPSTFHYCNKDNQALRKALWSVYNGVCQYCRNPIDNYRDMEVDHILPSKYTPPKELDRYIDCLNHSGFRTDKPNYVENYFPSHGSCNRDKSNDAGSIPLVFWHEIAFKNAEKVLKLMEQYKETP